MYIVQLEKGCWLTSGVGDPPRTLIKETASKFKTEASAKSALTKARKFRKFESAEIIES